MQRNTTSSLLYQAVFACFCIGLMLPCTAFSQDNFIARVENSHHAGIVEFIQREAGSFHQNIPLDETTLICFSGSQTLKAKVRRMAGVLGVSDDPEVQWINPSISYVLGETTHSEPPESQKYDDFFYELQWGHNAVQAAKAWQYGRGEGVRLALLDNGIDANHKDIGPNLNTALSVSFVPQENWPARSGFYFHHGTHVAGLIAAAENSYGGIGVAPKSEIVAVKVASESTGSGAFSWLLRGIVYAAEQQADIAHVGLGAMLPKERVSGLAAVELQDMLEVVARHAYDSGVLLFAPAGDDQKNLDDCCLYLPGGAEPFITVSAVSPKGWAFDPYTNLHLAASYSNFGQTYADLSAPGGDVQHPGNEACTIAGMKRPCWVFDLVFSTTAEGWAWASGTSAASAHAAGVAALIKSWHTDASAKELESLLLSYASKAGKKPGDDVFYGRGIANAYAEPAVIASSAHDHATIPIQGGQPSLSTSQHEAPLQFDLYQNYPNPFNPKTTINFHVPYDTQVRISVYDMTGRELATLVNQELAAGCYDTFWNGRNEDGQTVSSGVYMYKLDTGSFVDAKVMTFANN